MAILVDIKRTLPMHPSLVFRDDVEVVFWVISLTIDVVKSIEFIVVLSHGGSLVKRSSHSIVQVIGNLEGSDLLVDSTDLVAIGSVGFASNVPESVELVEVVGMGTSFHRLFSEIIVVPVSTLDSNVLHGVWDSVVMMMSSISADEAESSDCKFVHS